MLRNGLDIVGRDATVTIVNAEAKAAGLARARGLNVAGSEKIPFIGNLTVLLVGLKDADKKAEGETVFVIVRENGLFKYTDVLGASRTVKQFDVISDILPQSSNK